MGCSFGLGIKVESNWLQFVFFVIPNKRREFEGRCQDKFWGIISVVARSNDFFQKF
jgi:hypothetical protein